MTEVDIHYPHELIGFRIVQLALVMTMLQSRLPDQRYKANWLDELLDHCRTSFDLAGAERVRQAAIFRLFFQSSHNLFIGWSSLLSFVDKVDVLEKPIDVRNLA